MTTQQAPTLIRKTVRATVKVLDAPQGLVQANVNTMGVIDHDGDIIAPDAFTESFGRLPPVAWMHDPRVLVGGVKSAKQVSGRGGSAILQAVMQFDLDTEQGSYAFKMVERGRVDEWSVGFYPQQVSFKTQDGREVRVIETVDWVEVSPVLRGASPGTATTDVKEKATIDALAPRVLTPHEEAARELVTIAREQLKALGVEIDDPPPTLAETAPEAAQAAFFVGGEPEVKAGRRNSEADQRRVQTMFDLAVELGARCPTCTARDDAEADAEEED